MPNIFHEIIGKVERAGDQVIIQVGRDLQFQVEGMSARVGDRSDIGYANRAIAGHMRDAALATYDAHQTGNPHTQRRRGRDSGGKLRNALKRHLVSGAGQSIAYLDVGSLDQEARHWARMNYGVSGTEIHPADSPRIPVSVDFGTGSPTTTYIGGGFGPSKPYSLPAGIFLKGGSDAPVGMNPSRRGQDAFVPVLQERGGPRTPGSIGGGQVSRKFRGTSGVPTRGQRPLRFIEAGLQAFADNFSPVYRNMIERKWFNFMSPNNGGIRITRIR